MSYMPNQEKIKVSSTGDLTVASVQASGAVSAGSISSTGAVSASTITTTSTVSSGGNLTVTGTITASGDITAFSDSALKEDVKPIENALNKVAALTGVTYLKDGKQSVGLIAQNVEQIIPEAIQKNDQYMSVAYGNLVGVLIEAIKELNKELKELKEKV